MIQGMTWRKLTVGHARGPFHRMGAALGILDAFRVHDDSEGYQVALLNRYAEHVEALQTLAGGNRLAWYTLDGLPGKWVLCWRPISEKYPNA